MVISRGLPTSALWLKNRPLALSWFTALRVDLLRCVEEGHQFLGTSFVGTFLQFAWHRLACVESALCIKAHPRIAPSSFLKMKLSSKYVEV